METVIILAGGFGTRLNSVLNGAPKPMANINGIPFLELLIDNLIINGFSDFILSLHFKAQEIVNYFKDKNYKIRFIIEDEPLGTGGAVALIVKELSLSGYIYITNGDSWMDFGYSKFKNEERNVISLIEVNNTSRYGRVKVSENNEIIKFLEKADVKEKGLINSGFYKLNSNIFKGYDTKSFSIETELFPSLVNNNNLFGKIINANFIDIGIPEDYHKFCKLEKSGAIRRTNLNTNSLNR